MMFRIPIRHHVVMQGKLLDTRQWLVRSVSWKKGCRSEHDAIFDLCAYENSSASADMH